ncbi:reverse transcriptase domain-containing protein [Tanacetum coccineum]
MSLFIAPSEASRHRFSYTLLSTLAFDHLSIIGCLFPIVGLDFVTRIASVAIRVCDTFVLLLLLSNKEKLLELANTPLNENCSAVILKKLLEKLGDPGKFLIPCGFSELKCKVLADLGASINLMPLSVWKKLGLPELISTRMTLELANRAICTPAGIARDVFVPVGKFTFPADFVIVDYESDPRVPLILGRPFLWTARALIDVHGEEMILRDGDERLILNMRHNTSSYSNKPKKESINMIDIYNVSHKDYLEDFLANEKITNHQSGNPTFSSHIDLTSSEVINLLSGNPTPISEPVTKIACGGAHTYYQCLAADGNTFRYNIHGYVSAAAINYNQVVPLSELEKIKKINEVNIKAMQAQINNVKNELRNEMQTSIQASMSNQTNELKNMMASFFQMNTASTSGTGSLPSSTIANWKGELKAITTQSGLVLDGPSVPMPPPFINPKEDERVGETLTDPELAKYTIKVPPPLVQIAKPTSLKNYVVHQRDPLHPNIPYPLRMHQEKEQEKDEV